MSKFSEYIGSQFADPRGFIGRICCLIMNIINRSMYKSTVKNLSVDINSQVLDIGYGNGYLINKLYKKYGCNLYGIDISDDMLAVASIKNRKGIKKQKIKLIIGDCCLLPYSDGLFDCVTTVNTIYFWQNTEKGLKEIYRVLKDGGKFINAVYSKEWLNKLAYTSKGFKLFNEEELINLGYNAGFSKVQIKQISKNKNYIVQYDK